MWRVCDSTGLLHADIDTLSGGFNSGHLDPVGFKGELGNYTDLETQQAVAGLYTALSGPGGASYYDPMTGVGMARDQADSINEYSDNLNSIEPALHSAFVDVTGLLPGPLGSVGAGLIDGEITYIETGNAKTALVRGGTTAGIGLAFGKAGHFLGGPLSSALASRLSEEAAPAVAGAASDLARKGCFVAGTPVQMADGSTKPIEQVRAGDFVKSRNPQTGVTEARRVLQTTVRQTDQVLTLALTDPKTGRQEFITTTGEHPFFVEGRGFVKAGDLGIGTSIVTRAGPVLTLSHLTWQNAAPSSSLLLDGQAHAAGYRVYNLIVEGDHTYFVGTTGGGAWVHNVDCPPVTQAYEVGDYRDLFARRADGANQIHHLPQAHVAEQVIPGYERDKAGKFALAIALPKVLHENLPSTSRLRGSFIGLKPSEQRKIFSQQLRDLEKAGVPQSAVKDLERQMRVRYPSVYVDDPK